jgi:hypothetical protein
MVSAAVLSFILAASNEPVDESQVVNANEFRSFSCFVVVEEGTMVLTSLRVNYKENTEFR